MELVYLIKWRDCIGEIANESDIKIINASEEGILINTDNDAELVNRAINAGCTAYARYYRFRLVKVGDLDKVKRLIRPFNIWLDGDVLNLVINPLRLSTLDIAKTFYSLNFELVLLSEDDVEFMK